MITVMKHKFEKACSAFFSVVILGFALSFILAACKSENDIPENELPENGTPTENLTMQIRTSSEHLLALAVCRVYDGKIKSSNSFYENTEGSPLFSIKSLGADENDPVKYEFDFVKIGEAEHYLARGVDFPFLNEICGKDEIEVFLTYFNTYVYADETKDENNIVEFVGDGLIVFRGELGMYACMLNSGSSQDGVDESVYSSHKRFADHAIEKDFTPPVYEFHIKTENKQTSLACDVLTDENGNSSSSQWTNLQGGDIVNSDNLFSTVELTAIPEISLKCTITGMGDDYFLVESDSNLEKLYFDDYTQFLVQDQSAASSDFANGDMITVTFDRLYERYNPKVAFANKIEK